MRDALNRRFDVVLAESLDRFSRDQEDTAGLFKRLTFAGVNIVTIAEGDITHLHIGFKGTMNALFLKDLAEKTHRGCAGGSRTASPAAASATAIGSSRRCNGGNVTTGEREIEPAEAAIVERDVPRVRRRRLAEANRQDLESGGRAGPIRRHVESEHDQRQREARHRDAEQRAVRRPSRVEPAAVRQEPGHGQTRGADEPVEPNGS